jgi:hypothetical protein
MATVMAAKIVEYIETVTGHDAVKLKEVRSDQPHALTSAVAYVKTVLEDESVYDVLGLRQQMWDDVKSRLRVFMGAGGHTQLIVIEERDNPVIDGRILTLWGRILGMFRGPVRQQQRIVWFAHPAPRHYPSRIGVVPGPESVNGGYCSRCRPDTIVIYRKEDATRVLIHELLHATCADSTATSVPFIEAETEAWAEIIHAVILGGASGLKKQIRYAQLQNQVLRDKYAVRGPADYAWRYTLGKEEVWERLGFIGCGTRSKGQGKGHAHAHTAFPRTMCLTYNPLPACN